jgi:hypothetical protein
MFAIYSKVANVVRVHHSHLTEDQAENEVQRLNSHLRDVGQTAVFWAEPHHPECVFVIG